MSEAGDDGPPWWTGPVLGAVAGAVDAAGFLFLFGLFTAHISGNTTGFGVAVGTADWQEAAKRIFMIPVFVASTAAAVAASESMLRRDASRAGRARALWLLLVVEALLVVVFTVSASTIGARADFVVDSAAFFFIGSVAAMAMGVQNAALRRVSGLAVHTTFVTGQLTEAAISFVHWRHARGALRGRPQADDEERATLLATRDAARATLDLSVAVWCAYLAGGIASAWLVVNVSRWLVLVPVAVILATALSIARAGRSSVTSSAAS
jgi:uncharacterized membrane protein YoaK (UPF0700 family)